MRFSDRKVKEKMKLKKVIFVILGLLSLVLGAIGTVVPVLPTVPFFMVAAFCFAKSSKKLHTWFTGTKLYKENLESYIEGRGMTWETKRRIMTTVTLLMTFGFIVMFAKALYIPCMILGCVWLFHVGYFVFRVKTI